MTDGPSGNQAGLTKGARITGDQRSSLGAVFGQRYAGGESIRSIAQDTGRSYGFVHGVLKESGASLRGRGGATRGPRRSSAQPVVTAAESTATETLTKAKKIVDKVADKAGKAKTGKDDKGKKKAELKKSSKKGKKS